MSIYVIAEGGPRFWFNKWWNGAIVDNFLPECAWAILCGVAWLTHTRKCRWLKANTKNLFKLVLKQKYQDYEHSLLHLNLDSFKQRRDILCYKFSKAGIKYDKLKDLLPVQGKLENIKTRNQNKYNVNFALTGCLKSSSIISIQKMLNNDAANEESRKRSCG